jgi:hypothetical protein
MGYSERRQQVLLAEARMHSVEEAVERLDQQAASRLAASRGELQAIQNEMQRQSAEWQAKVNEIRMARAAQPMHMAIVGPPAVEAGSSSQFEVRLSNRLNQPDPVAAQVTAEILDAHQKPLPVSIEVQKQAPGRFRLSLPRDLPLGPNADFYLAVSARGEAGDAGRAFTMTEKLALTPPLLVTHLATDKPMYQPGEVVHFRSLTLERFSLKPAREQLHLNYTITTPRGEKQPVLSAGGRLVRENDAKGGLILGPDKRLVSGIGAGEYLIDADAPGGEYTLTVSEAANRFAPQERKFLVNRYEKPRLNKELEFTRKSYGPGDEVIAVCKVARAEGGQPVAERPVTATVRIDGKTYGADGKEAANMHLQTDAAGAVSVKFRLPGQIERGEATLAVAFDDGGSVETIVRPIPVVVKKLQVEFFPEGGDLIAGVPNRVYFQVRTPLDKPAEVKGRIVSDRGDVVAKARTFNDPDKPGANQGMGSLDFTPKFGARYEFRVDSPAGIKGDFHLPVVKDDGVVLSVRPGVIPVHEAIRLAVTSGQRDRSLIVGAYCRGRLMAQERLEAKRGQPTAVVLTPGLGTGGVYRVTVYEELATDPRHPQLVPRAERLVYRTPAEPLKFAVKPDQAQNVPGEQVKLHITATDEKDRPAPAIAMVAVVDKSVLKLADEKTYREMPTHFLLTTEVRRPEDLEHADFMLGSDASAPIALDLLLGTQGWRRFAEQDPLQFRQKQHEEADRLLVSLGQVSPVTLGAKATEFDAEAIRRASVEFRAKSEALRERLEKAESQHADSLKQWQQAQSQTDGAHIAADMARRHYGAAVGRLAKYEEWMRNLVMATPLVLLVFVVVVIIRAIGVRRVARTSLYVLGTVCAVVLLVVISMIFEGGEKQHAGPVFGMANQTARRPAAAQAHAQAEGLVFGNKDLKERGPVPAPRNTLRAGEAGHFNVPAAAPQAARGSPPEEPQARLGLPGKVDLKAGAAWRSAIAAPRQPIAAMQANKEMDRAKVRVLEIDKLGKGIQLKQGAVKSIMPGMVPSRDDGLFGQVNERAWQDGVKFGTPGSFGRGIGGIGGGGWPPQAANPYRWAPMLRQGEIDARAGVAVGSPVNAEPPPCVVREYAHHRTSASSELRSDFAETLYWNPVLILADGQADASFQLCDSVTTFQVLVAGHTTDGRLGAVTKDVESRLPITSEPKLPIEVTASDKLALSLSVANNTSVEQSLAVRLQAKGLNVVDEPAAHLALPPNGRARHVYRLQPTIQEGQAEVHIDTEGFSFAADRVARSIKVVPDGFPVQGAKSDLLEGVVLHDFTLPQSWVKGTLKYKVAAYPSTLATLQQGLESLLREPCGCFEQTSSSNYPNVLILDYLQQTDQARPELARRAKELLAHGYEKLTSFECLNQAASRREGYEWFGGTAPPHEALTAYGLMQFRDMLRVYDVDAAMVARTKEYLLSRRDGKGGFTRNPRALDHFGHAPEFITNAYIIWALTESSKEDDLSAELDALKKEAASSSDPYFLALAANSFVNRGRNEEAFPLLKKLAAAQQKDGHLDAAQTSITGSGGRDLQIETTALTLLAWLKAKRPDVFNENVQTAIKWLTQQRGGYGGFGSTQSTILALKALIAHAKESKKTVEAGDLMVFVSDQQVARRHFDAGAQDALTCELPDAERLLKPGKNRVRVEVSGRNVLPYTASWSCQALTPASATGCPVALRTRLDRTTATEGETVRLTVEVRNQTDQGHGMTVAIIGLPAGLTLPEDMKQLKDLARLRNDATEPGPISAWETRGRELVLYWRDLAPRRVNEVNLDLICRVPGEYRGPASRAYLYYNADQKCWIKPLEITIQAKEGE